MSGPFDGLVPNASEFRIELTKYDVLESGDPACPHTNAIEDTETKRRMCPCGRTETVAERHVMSYPGEGAPSC